tara:strand:+ start:162 stop:509 length:348 start_codon:yes stop_codon:yes gene_type:complete
MDRDTISKFISEKSDLTPYGIHASLSYHMYPFAREQIKKFFMDTSIDQILYGTSSGGMRTHNLIRLNNVIYVYHYTAWDKTNDAFYFTEVELNGYFEGFENDIPEFKNQFKFIDE